MNKKPTAHRDGNSDIVRDTDGFTVSVLTPHNPYPKVRVNLETGEPNPEFTSVLFHSAKMMKPGGGMEAGYIKKVTLQRQHDSKEPNPELVIRLGDSELPSVRLSEFLKQNPITDKQFERIDQALTKTPDLIQPVVLGRGI